MAFYGSCARLPPGAICPNVTGHGQPWPVGFIVGVKPGYGTSCLSLSSNRPTNEANWIGKSTMSTVRLFGRISRLLEQLTPLPQPKLWGLVRVGLAPKFTC